MDTIAFLREFRIGGYAVFDLLFAFVGIYFLAPVLTKVFRHIRLEIPRKSWMFFTLPLGIFIHTIIGTMTTMTVDFWNMEGGYILKILVMACIVLGMRYSTIIRKQKKPPTT